MPTPLMKIFAKEAGKKTKSVEKIWNNAEKLVKDKYDIDEDSDRFYPLVVGVVKNILGIRKKETVKEDGGGDGGGESPGGMNTTSMGDYEFANRLGVPFFAAPIPVKSSIKKKYTKKKIKKMKKISEDRSIDFDEMVSSMFERNIDKSEDLDEVIEMSLDTVSRYLNIDPSILDDIKE